LHCESDVILPQEALSLSREITDQLYNYNDELYDARDCFVSLDESGRTRNARPSPIVCQIPRCIILQAHLVSLFQTM